MFTKFWDELAEGLAGRWAAQALGPALVFWGGGLLAWVWHTGRGWQRLTNRLAAVDHPAAYVALAVGGLLVLAASSAVGSWLQLPVLRLLEGYWPWPFRRLRFWLARRVVKRLEKKEEEWQTLVAIEPEERGAEQQAEYARLDAQLARYPVDPRHLMPTRLGNILRAAEEYPLVRYGLTTGICWPRLWLAIPKEARDTLSQARQRLNGAARLFVWGLLFAVWTVWAWWAVPAALVVAVAAYWGMLHAAGVYGDLVRSAFDLYRFALYEQVRWPLPDEPQREDVAGRQLSEYLFRGTGSRYVTFSHPSQEG